MQTNISYKEPRRILHPTGGFLEGYTHSLNPYGGCSFACSYCYVRQMPIALFRGQEWGTWVEVKQGAEMRLRKEIQKAKQKGPVTIFMSSSTDPYQPVEHQAQITRSLLEVLVEDRPNFLFVQTRSPLVTRDIDLFLRIKDRIRISMTIETDLESVRKVFTPAAPPLASRLKALQKIVDHGLSAQAALAPVLPFSDRFPKILANIVDRVCLDDYFMGDGSGGKRTERLNIKKRYEENGMEKWYGPGIYQKALELLRKEFSDHQILISQEGFLP
jgi:DNA repair photolyase